MRQKPATASLVIAPSVPPVMARSESPNLIAWKASPIASVPEAHAVTVVCQGPFNPYRMAMFPAASFMINLGIVNGATALGPRSNSFSGCPRDLEPSDAVAHVDSRTLGLIAALPV